MKLKELVEKYGEYTVPQELIDKLEPPQLKSVWELEKGNTYYLIIEDGTVMQTKYTGLSQLNHIVMGDAFLTREEAEKNIERRQVETLLLRYGGRRWFKKDVWNYYLSFNNDLEILSVACTQVDYRQGAIYFDSEKRAKEVMNTIGSERIKKALFEVK